MNKQTLLFFLSALIIFTSCDKNGNEPSRLASSSVYVTNEGNFSVSDGSITAYDPSTDSTANKVFEQANNRPLAGLVQTARVNRGKMYIVLNRADKLEIMDTETQQAEQPIDLSISPTAIAIDGNTAYVTTLDYQSEVDSVLLVNLSTMKQTNKRIAVGSSPRGIIRFNDRLYVSNSGSNTVSVINTKTNTVSQTIDVGVTPSQMLIDNQQRIWVVCNGLQSYDDSSEPQPGSIYLLDARTGTVVDKIESEKIVPKPNYVYRLAFNIDQQKAYLLNNGVSTVNMNTLQLSSGKIIDRSFYSIGYFEKQEKIYLGQNKGYTQAGQAIIYNIQGAAVDSFVTGKAPNRFYFTGK